MNLRAKSGEFWCLNPGIRAPAAHVHLQLAPISGAEKVEKPVLDPAPGERVNQMKRLDGHIRTAFDDPYQR